MINKKAKRFLKKVLMCMIIVSLASSVSFAASAPADVAGSAQAEAVTALVEAGVITGSTDGLFHPLNNLTRAEACIIIVKAINPPNADIMGTPAQRVPSSGFSDMRGYGWAEGYVSYAVRNNIVTGYPDGTFKPGNNVTCDEMLTLTLRAAGFKDQEIGTSWPKDFIAKAEQEGITEGLAKTLPNLATKEIAARMVYNKLDELAAIGAAKEVEDVEDAKEEDDDKGGADNGNAPSGVSGLTFATGKFNDNITTYAGTPISRNVTVYTYGVKADYKKEMKLPAKESELRKDTINKYKLADTPCFYAKTGNEITMMVLPMDAGFSGRIYGVINGYSNTTNGKGEKVYNIRTLAAAQQVSWLTKDTNVTVPDSSEYLDGEIYELTSNNGAVNKIETASGGKGHKDFTELTASNGWEEVKDLRDSVIVLENGDMFATETKTVIYVLNSDGKSYKVGRQGDIKKGAEIRIFSISEDGEVASYITVNKK